MEMRKKTKRREGDLGQRQLKGGGEEGERRLMQQEKTDDREITFIL